MSEHAFFIRGLLDPTECELLNTTNRFGIEFNDLLSKQNQLIAAQLILQG
jgi:hypothetical protein